MKVRKLLGVVCAVLLALPLLANAEVYKWKDKNGEIRYSDTPPPSNIKLEQIGRKKVAKPTGSAPLSPVTDTAKMPVATAAPASDAKGKEGKEDDAAKNRQNKAEADKKTKEEKEKIAKIKEENCRTAKTNLASYQQGGRLFKVDEKGERHYFDDKELKEGAAKSQQDVSENCQ